jgi:hypothetical protein
MRRKTMWVLLVLVILLAFTGSAHSGRGWGIKTDDFGVVVVSAPAHPWGEQAGRSNNSPSSYRPGSGGGSVGAPTYADFVVQFFVRYVVKQRVDGWSSRLNNRGSE